MKVTVTGMREYNFKDDSGRQVEGMSIYFRSKLEPRDGQHGSGYCTEKIPVKKDTVLYAKMLGLDYSKPFEAEPKYEIMPGNRRPVLTDIIV